MEEYKEVFEDDVRDIEYYKDYRLAIFWLGIVIISVSLIAVFIPPMLIISLALLVVANIFAAGDISNRLRYSLDYDIYDILKKEHNMFILICWRASLMLHYAIIKSSKLIAEINKKL